MPAMMMTKVWPIATASSGHTLDSWLEMLRGSTSAGKNTADSSEVGERQVEDEVLREQQPAQQRQRGRNGLRRRCRRRAASGRSVTSNLP